MVAAEQGGQEPEALYLVPRAEGWGQQVAMPLLLLEVPRELVVVVVLLRRMSYQ